jgi:hypothetical protein
MNKSYVEEIHYVFTLPAIYWYAFMRTILMVTLA